MQKLEIIWTKGAIKMRDGIKDAQILKFISRRIRALKQKAVEDAKKVFINAGQAYRYTYKEYKLRYLKIRVRIFGRFVNDNKLLIGSVYYKKVKALHMPTVRQQTENNIQKG